VYYNHTQKCLFPKCIGLDKICCIAVEGITVGYMTSPAVPVPQAEKKNDIPRNSSIPFRIKHFLTRVFICCSHEQISDGCPSI